MFRQVTDMTWIPPATRSSATVHQSRVAKADKNGKWLKSFGEPATNPDSSTRRTASPRTRREHLRCQSRNARIEVIRQRRKNTSPNQDQRTV